MCDHMYVLCWSMHLQHEWWACTATGLGGVSLKYMIHLHSVKTSIFNSLFIGDCKNCIHLWEPASGSTWNVDSTPFLGHSASVEDLQVTYVNGSLLFFFSCSQKM